MLVVCFVVAAAEGFRADWFFRRLSVTIAVFGGAGGGGSAGPVLRLPPERWPVWAAWANSNARLCAALTFGVALLCALYWMFETPSRRWQAFAALNALCLISAVILTDSRNAWVAVPFACVVYLVSRRAKSAAMFAVIVIAFAALALAFVGSVLVGPAGELLLPRGDSFRPAIWAEILSRALAHGPWLGNGVLTDDGVLIGCYLMVHPQQHVSRRVVSREALVAIALFAALLALSIRTLLANFQRQEAKLALGIYALALPAYLLDGHELVTRIGWTWMLIWLPVAISVALSGGRRLNDANRLRRRLSPRKSRSPAGGPQRPIVIGAQCLSSCA